MWNCILLISSALAQDVVPNTTSTGLPEEEAEASEEPAPPPFDIRGPEWAMFGSELDALRENLADSGKVLNIGGRSCFSAERTVLDARWLVQACSYDGTTVESLTLYLTKEAVQDLGGLHNAEKLGPLYSKLRAGLEGQYGTPTATVEGKDIWLDFEGDQMTLWSGEYSFAPGWKALDGIPRFAGSDSGLAPNFPGIVLGYRQAPGLH